MKVLAAIVASAALLSGCATVVSGPSQQVTFNSEPQEATVTVAGKALGKTPITANVSRDKNVAVTFEKEGYKTYTTQLSTTLNGWFWGNIVIGGLLGSTTDGLSGAINEYSPNQYFVTLVPEKPFGTESNRPKDIKQMLLGFGAEIRGELAVGGGSHVNELLAAIGVTEDKQAQAVAALKNMAVSEQDNLEFAKKIIEVFEVK